MNAGITVFVRHLEEVAPKRGRESEWLDLPVSSTGEDAEKEVASLPRGLLVAVRALLLASTSSGTRSTSLRDSSTSSPGETSRITSRNNWNEYKGGVSG